MTREFPKYRYRLDPDDVLIWVDELWLGFAKENGAAELTSDFVLGRSLWEFVAGRETRELFQLIHARVRATGAPVVLPFRCDSPSLKRFMRLKITREEEEQLLYESQLVRVEPRDHLRVLDSREPRSESLLTMCSCCKRTLLEPVGWLEIEDITARLRLFEARKVPGLRHTVCPPCAQAMRESAGNGNAA